MGARSRPHKVWAGAGAMVECKQEGSGPNPRTAKERKKKKQQDLLTDSPLTEQASGPGPGTNEIQPRWLLRGLQAPQAVPESQGFGELAPNI